MAPFTITLAISISTIFLELAQIVNCDYNEFCVVPTCADPSQHTLCLWPKAGVDRTKEECQGPHVRMGVTEAQEEVILHEHNRLRSRVALGLYPDLPKASNMTKLVYDHRDMGKIAQRWADQCVFANDICRDFEDRTGLGEDRKYELRCAGQNIAMGLFHMNTPKPSINKAIKLAIRTWYKQGMFLPPSQIDNFTSVFGKENKSVGHFTQLVWAETTTVGCGILGLKPDEGMTHQKFHLICNYFGAGNVLGAPVYKKGAVRSGCKHSDVVNRDYPGLCAFDKFDRGEPPAITNALENHAFTAKVDLPVFVFFCFAIVTKLTDF